MNYRKTIEQIEIVAYLAKHKPLEEDDPKEVYARRTFLNDGIRKYRMAFSNKQTPPNRDYQWCLEERARLDDILYKMKFDAREVWV